MTAGVFPGAAFRLCPKGCAGAKKELDITSHPAYLRTVSIGQAVREAREARGWNQDELAERVGAVRETISRWETGHRIIPRRSLLALENLLGPLGKDESKRSRKVAAKS